ncbi:hypothetical protein [Streptomyces sp. NPDC052012]|uniref:hypothetical protein n=1 Tax=Streptomyces sp. NPDC052012 TaxID=3155051 RepID=UPI00344BD819
MTDATRHPENPTGGTGRADGSESPLVAAHPQPADTGTGTGPDTTTGPRDTRAWETGGTPGARDTRTGEAAGTPGARDTRTEDTARTPGARDTRAGDAAGAGQRLLPRDDGDKLAAQLQHAVAGFVDTPRDAVREADQVLQELTERVTHAVTERRRTLRRSWQSADTGEGGTTAATDTEQLRLALRDYRELAEKLLHV